MNPPWHRNATTTNGVPENRDESFKWYKQSSGSSYVPAYQKLAHCYLNGIGTDKNEAAADQGHALANYCLGNFYRSGTWVDADKQKAFECYTKAAELGNSDGIERLGECYFNGDGVEMDHDAAFQYMRHAAELGNPKGQCYVGLFHLEGIGCRQDMELGFRWISEAVQSGHIAVFKLLQQRGLDFAKLSTGYREYRQLPPLLTENCVVRSELDSIFDTTSKGILPVAPDEV